MFILVTTETTSLHMLSAILNVFILNYLTTHVVCHLECVHSKLTLRGSFIHDQNKHDSTLKNIFLANLFLSQCKQGISLWKM